MIGMGVGDPASQRVPPTLLWSCVGQRMRSLFFMRWEEKNGMELKDPALEFRGARLD